VFRENDGHNQQTLLGSTQWMDPKVREKLLKSWAPIFYEHVFCRIDEKPFSVLYGTTGNPNFPVNIMLSLEYIKHMRDCSDLELLDAFSFDYQVNHAVGIQTLGEKNLAERTLYAFRRKGDVSQSSYVPELSETCSRENLFQLITDYKVEPNNVSYQEILTGRLETIRENTGCTDMYVDGGFHSEVVHKTAEDNGIEIHLTNMSGTEPKKKLAVTEYNIDVETNVIMQCPGGYEPVRTNVSSGQTSAHFPLEACSNCEHFEQCHSKMQKKDCVVRISLKAVEASRERETMKTDMVENTSMRAWIEGSNSALKRNGLDKLNVRGKTKVEIVCGLKTTVQNIKRFIKFMCGGYKEKPMKSPPGGILAPSCA
jgi:hypothetical protein